MRVEVHPDAAAEANEAYNWYKESAPTLAEDFFSEVFRIIALTAKQPRMWRVWPGVPAKYAVAHLRRKPKYWLMRLRSVK